MPQHGYTGSHIGFLTGTWNEEVELDGRSRKLEPAMRWSGIVREIKEGVTSIAGGPGTGPVISPLAGPIALDNPGVIAALRPGTLLPPGSPVPIDGTLVDAQPHTIEFDVAGVAVAPNDVQLEIIAKDGWGQIVVVPLVLTVNGLAQALIKATFKRIIAIRITKGAAGATLANFRVAPEVGLKYPLGSTDGTCVIKELLNGGAPAAPGTFVGPSLDPLVGDPRGTWIPDPAAGGPNDYDMSYLPSRVDALEV